MKTKNNLTWKELQTMLWDCTESTEWEEHYYPDQLAKSTVIEATRLLSEFQWLDNTQINEYVCTDADKQRIAYQIINVLYYVLMLGDSLDIDLMRYVYLKLQNPHTKYPM